jgi:hypothetical protein
MVRPLTHRFREGHEQPMTLPDTPLVVEEHRSLAAREARQNVGEGPESHHCRTLVSASGTDAHLPLRLAPPPADIQLVSSQDLSAPAATRGTTTRAQMSARLAPFEHDNKMDIEAASAAAAEVEKAAQAAGEIDLVMRARLVQADIADRKGQCTAAVPMIWAVNRWALETQNHALLAQSHGLLARCFRSLGDPAAFLEHSVAAVETLDDAAPPLVRVYYLIRLADALGDNGSFDAAR